MSEVQGNARLTTTDSFLSRDMRLVAIDEKGTPHTGRILNSETADKSRIATAVFEGLRLDQVKEFQLHTRPFQWAEFTNVSLHSGKARDVKVTVNADSITPFGQPGTVMFKDVYVEPKPK